VNPAQRLYLRRFPRRHTTASPRASSVAIVSRHIWCHGRAATDYWAGRLPPSICPPSRGRPSLATCSTVPPWRTGRAWHVR